MTAIAARISLEKILEQAKGQLQGEQLVLLRWPDVDAPFAYQKSTFVKLNNDCLS